MVTAWHGSPGRIEHLNRMSRHFWNIDDLAMNGSSFAHYWQKGSLRFMINRIFFSVQRLHGFRQVVTHVQLQQKDEL